MFLEIIETIIKTTVILGLAFISIPIISSAEYKTGALIQKWRRLGTKKPFMARRPLADFFKLLFKEEALPHISQARLFRSAPLLAFLINSLPFAGIPLCSPFELNGNTIYPEVFQSELGIIYIYVALTFGHYAILLGGWASNNNFSIMAAIRTCALTISYQIPLLIVTLTMLFVYQTVDIHQIVQRQNLGLISFIPQMGIFIQPLSCFIFIVCAIAASNRAPFDLGESGSELVAGYHIEYSSMRLALFSIAGYLQMIAMSVLFVYFFLGGYGLIPGMNYFLEKIPSAIALLQLFSLLIKTFMVTWFFSWIRWALPSFSYEGVMALGWQRLLPLALLNFIITAAFIFIKGIVN